MQPPNLCIHFQRGFCSYGSSCRFLHQQVGAFVQRGGHFGGSPWTEGQRRGARGGGQYSYYQESIYQSSRSYRPSVPQPTPTREWSAPSSTPDPAQQRDSFNFRFMSWNILAAELACTHASELYPQAHPSYLDWPRRLAAVVRHVDAQRPDVLCLQEVDDWPSLSRELAELGYDGVHLQRTGGRGDGCATLWLRDRLRLADCGSGRDSGVGARSTGAGSRDLAASWSQSGSGSCGGDGSVHRIRMADHGLKDNVALLVHLLPRCGGRGDGRGGNTAGPAAGSSEGSERERRGAPGKVDLPAEDEGMKRNSSGGGSGSEGSQDGGQHPLERPAGQRRRPKRTRQSCEGDAAAAAAVVALASLQPYPHAAQATAGLNPAMSAPARLQIQPDRCGGGACGGRGGGARGAGVDTLGLSPSARSDSIEDETKRDGSGRSGDVRLPQHLCRGFWVANTHILFNIKRGDIKLGQLRVILSELAARASAAEVEAADVDANAPSASASAPPPSVPVIFAGDFNAAPGSGLYRYLRYGELQLRAEDRRELSGQLEGYGYSQLQRDAMSGRPLRLERWCPGPELRDRRVPTAGSANAGSAAFAAGAAAVAFYARSGSTYKYGSASGPSSNTEEWRRAQRQQVPSLGSRSYSVRWEEEELVHAMGRVAVVQAVASVREGAAAASGGNGGFPGGQGTREVLLGGNGNCDSNGDRFRIPQAPMGGQGAQSGGGGNGAPWREQAVAAAAHWRAVTETAVVRHPLQLRSAYAAVDEQEREPLFTTMHARYVGTVDFVWFTPGREERGAHSAGIKGAGAASGGQASEARKEEEEKKAGKSSGGGGGVRGGSAGFSLTPVRVLHPPDPLSYPYGMPCADWPSDHVSLVVDFRLR